MRTPTRARVDRAATVSALRVRADRQTDVQPHKAPPATRTLGDSPAAPHRLFCSAQRRDCAQATSVPLPFTSATFTRFPVPAPPSCSTGPGSPLPPRSSPRSARGRSRTAAGRTLIRLQNAYTLATRGTQLAATAPVPPLPKARQRAGRARISRMSPSRAHCLHAQAARSDALLSINREAAGF